MNDQLDAASYNQALDDAPPALALFALAGHHGRRSLAARFAVERAMRDHDAATMRGLFADRDAARRWIEREAPSLRHHDTWLRTLDRPAPYLDRVVAGFPATLRGVDLPPLHAIMAP